MALLGGTRRGRSGREGWLLRSGCAGVLLLARWRAVAVVGAWQQLRRQGQGGSHLGDAAGQALEPADTKHKENGAAINAN